MLVKLLKAVIMFTAIKASIHGSQGKIVVVDKPDGFLNNILTELHSKVEEVTFSHDSEDNTAEVTSPMDFVSNVVTDKSERIFDRISNFSSKVKQLLSQDRTHVTQGQTNGVDYSMGSLSSMVTQRPFPPPPNFSSKDKVAQLPSIHGNQGQITDVDYSLGSLSNMLAGRPFPPPPYFSSKDKVTQLPSQLSILDRQGQIADVDYPMGSLSNNVAEKSFHRLPLFLSKGTKKPFPLQPNLSSKLAEILGERSVSNPTKSSSSSSYEESVVTTKSSESLLSTMTDASTIKAISDELMMKTNFGSLPFFNVQGPKESYGGDISNQTKIQYCIWYDNEKEKEYKLQSGTRWSGNGCQSLECKDGVIIPDPSCCKIETHLNGYTSIYYLYKSHGEKWIKACELLACDYGLITKQKRIPGCCVYDHTGSKADGESWWAYSAGKDNNFCKVGRCTNGKIEVMQVEEGGSWRNGCFDHVCKDSDFVMTRVDLPGSCNINHGGCIVNGTIEKIWSKCQGIFCINGNLYKGEMKYCSKNDLLLYKRYNV